MSECRSKSWVPKVIHQTWKTKQLPEKYEKNSAAWKELHPEYQYVLYDDNDLRREVEKTFPHYLNFYRGMTSHIERVDFARYVILYNYGGIYADLDTIPIKKFDSLINTYQITLGEEPIEHTNAQHQKLICNAIMLSPSRKEFWKQLIDFIVATYEHNMSPIETTGPYAIYRFLSIYKNTGHELRILSPCVFYSVTNERTKNDIIITGDLDKQHNLKCISAECMKGKNKNVIHAVHLWDNTWVKKKVDDPRWKNKRYRTYALSFTIGILMLIFVLNMK